VVWLILGVLMWSTVHSLPCAGQSLRGRLLQRLGEGPYKGLFALAIVLSITSTRRRPGAVGPPTG
jgi:uncharacterized membrane protein